MKLTQEQIQEIEYALNKRGIDYIDLKYELLDHIATDIEQLMTEDKTISFEEAFNQAFYKWKDALRNSSSLLLGLAYSRPKIVVQACVNILKRGSFMLTLYGGAITLVLYLLIKLGLLHFSEFFFNVVGILQFIIGGGLLLLFFHIKSSSYKTSYSFIYNINVAPFSIYYFIFNYNITMIGYPFEGGFLSLISLFVQVEMLLYPLFAYRVFKNHFKLRERKVFVS
ncbi:hypothetical protein JoomaDRAFT_1357 [Galbibacter orientalis DSM 19592]|uniref:Uncharacterized protein n=1 Tax=Galbibacter orientalis DSM 19592 TaxID=926559 RepID=I3C429_9FLAO|nr:hypothetical protein [Galbibacter orientalis]EIJ38372.1 hypothetical protein JoomaDRAFT_1357 [Galbibacter orientalis DSM 19592]